MVSSNKLPLRLIMIIIMIISIIIIVVVINALSTLIRPIIAS